MPELRNPERLAGVHPDLVRVVKRGVASAPFDVQLLEGLRTIETQRRYVASGASQTMNSRHLTGHAVDLAPIQDGKVSWHWPHYHILAPIMKAAAAAEKVPVTWGGDWRFKDGPHWELQWAAYPKGANPAGQTSSPNPTLRQGAKGDAVKRLQTALRITADGIFGPRTHAAVKAFQTDNALHHDGVVGALTWAKLVAKEAGQ